MFGPNREYFPFDASLGDWSMGVSLAISCILANVVTLAALSYNYDRKYAGERGNMNLIGQGYGILSKRNHILFVVVAILTVGSCAVILFPVCILVSNHLILDSHKHIVSYHQRQHSHDWRQKSKSIIK
jgi:hypothetical protein